MGAPGKVEQLEAKRRKEGTVHHHELLLFTVYVVLLCSPRHLWFVSLYRKLNRAFGNSASSQIVLNGIAYYRLILRQFRKQVVASALLGKTTLRTCCWMEQILPIPSMRWTKSTKCDWPASLRPNCCILCTKISRRVFGMLHRRWDSGKPLQLQEIEGLWDIHWPTTSRRLWLDLQLPSILNDQWWYLWIGRRDRISNVAEEIEVQHQTAETKNFCCDIQSLHWQKTMGSWGGSH